MFAISFPEPGQARRSRLRPLTGPLAVLSVLLMSSTSGVVSAQDETAGVQDPSTMANVVTIKSDDELGRILAGPNGMTAYYAINPASNRPDDSACALDSACAVVWPPLLVSDVPTGPDGIAGDLGTITRSDGGLQATFRTWPLYLFSGDEDDEDTYGQNVMDNWGLWRAIRLDVLEAADKSSGAATPAPAPVPTAPPAPGPPPTPAPTRAPTPTPSPPPYRYSY